MTCSVEVNNVEPTPGPHMERPVVRVVVVVVVVVFVLLSAGCLSWLLAGNK